MLRVTGSFVDVPDYKSLPDFCNLPLHQRKIYAPKICLPNPEWLWYTSQLKFVNRS